MPPLPLRYRDEKYRNRKMAMFRVGLTRGSLAKEWGVTGSFVSRLIGGDSRSYLHELHFTYITGEPYEKLWPRPKDFKGNELPYPTVADVANADTPPSKTARRKRKGLRRQG